MREAGWRLNPGEEQCLEGGGSRALTKESERKWSLSRDRSHGGGCAVTKSYSTLCDPMDCLLAWTAASQASLSFTISQSLLKLMCIELVIPSDHFQGRTGESGAFGLWPHPRGSSRISS